MKRKQLIFVVFAVLGILKVSGQSSVSSPTIDLYEHTPSSPTTAGLGKYFEFPVQMNTGIPSIQIPIYTIKTGNITLPISISYHAGGVRVEEVAGPVGMNWTLNTGGIMTRRVNGLDDFYGGTQIINCGTYLQPNYSTYSSIFNNIADVIDSFGHMNRWEIDRFIGRITEGNVDGESDEYFYSTPTGSGKIYYNQRKQQFQIDKLNGWQPIYNSTSQFGGDWTLITNDNLYYSFGKVEKTTHPMRLKPQILPPGVILTDTILPASWYMTQILDQDHGKTVNFSYSSVWQYRTMGYQEMREYAMNGQRRGTSQERTEKEGDEFSIDSINFDLGKIHFLYDATPRNDGGPKNVKEIRVVDLTNSILKRFVFTYFYDTTRKANNTLDTLYQTLFLESVQEISIVGGDTLKIPPYKFVYDFNKHLPRRFSFAQDTWGFYNGKLSNGMLIDNALLTVYGTEDAGIGGDRSVDTVYTKAGIIKELHYPTGGKAIFEFENNRIDNEIAGGLRIKRIKNYDSVANSTLTTEYEYKLNNGSGSGLQLFAPLFYYEYLDIPQSGGGPMLIRFENQPIYPLFPYQGSPVFYSQVTKKDTSAQGVLKSKHNFNSPQVIGGGLGVPHPKVSIVEGNEEFKREIYKQNGDNSYTLIKKTESEIGTLKGYADCIWNIQTAWALQGTGIFARWQGNDPWVQVPELNMDINDNRYQFCRESNVVKEITTTDYAGTDQLVNKSYFEYDTSNGNNTAAKTVNSKGDTLIKVTKFASEYGKYSGGTTDRNYQLGILTSAKPVEVMIYNKKAGTNDSLLTDATFFEYSNGEIKKIYKVYVDTAILNFHPSYNDSYDLYFDSRYALFQEVETFGDYNVPLTVIANEKKEAYIWDYDGNYMVAQVKNASSENIAYSSFETSFTGNWTISGGSISPTYAVTGKKCYSLSGGNTISKSGLTSDDYIISYWSRSGSMTVNSTSGVSGVTKDGWTFYQHTLTGITSVTLSGTGYIDELRLCPKASLMATLTYQPLIGIASQCDANNRITYYVYDSFGRLKLIKDEDGNILKRMEYKYLATNQQ